VDLDQRRFRNQFEIVGAVPAGNALVGNAPKLREDYFEVMEETRRRENRHIGLDEDQDKRYQYRERPPSWMPENPQKYYAVVDDPAGGMRTTFPEHRRTADAADRAAALTRATAENKRRGYSSAGGTHAVHDRSDASIATLSPEEQRRQIDAWVAQARATASGGVDTPQLHATQQGRQRHGHG